MPYRPAATAAATDRAAREFDVIVVGATGFVGRQVVAYLAQHAGTAAPLRFAVAGRSAQRLQAVVDAHAAGMPVPVLVAEADDAQALTGLAQRTRVVIATAGPFAKVGSALVAACVAAGTHYVDITGETSWVREQMDLHHDAARANGTRIVPCCGFDSVPADIGAWMLLNALGPDGAAAGVQISAAYSMRGGINGGTLASALNMIDSGGSERMRQPFLLNPAAQTPTASRAHADPTGAHHDAELGGWLAPFVMSVINTRVVRRSAALLGYGPEFVYQEYMRVGRGPAAGATASLIAASMQIGQAALQIKPLRRAASRMVPAPGQGPSKWVMDHGRYRAELVARSPSGEVLARARVAGPGDPGNRATTRFVCEAALALVHQLPQLPGGPQWGGVLTPASAFGAVLVQRLRAAGDELTVTLSAP